MKYVVTVYKNGRIDKVYHPGTYDYAKQLVKELREVKDERVVDFEILPNEPLTSEDQNEGVIQ